MKSAAIRPLSADCASISAEQVLTTRFELCSSEFEDNFPFISSTQIYLTNRYSLRPYISVLQDELILERCPFSKHHSFGTFSLFFSEERLMAICLSTEMNEMTSSTA